MYSASICSAREFDRLWDTGGFGFWLANYQDILSDQAANDLCADYIRRKIRKAVKDPVVAEKLELGATWRQRHRIYRQRIWLPREIGGTAQRGRA
jgi:hypothetical protein